jgi:replicative DNA helicase
MTQLAKYTIAADALTDWKDDLLSGKPPTLYNVGTGDLSRIEIGPGRVVLIGGVPGGGKTALATQLTFDALRTTPSLRAVVANVEMTPAVLLDRQLARVSGIPLDAITHRRLDEPHAERLDTGIATLESIGDRLAFVRPPFDLGNIAAVVDAIDADLIVLDYVQRIRPPGEHADRRGSVDALMDYLRQFADAGKALVCVAAVARSKDKRGRSSYDGDALNLASFRESSELEYGADSAYILVPGDDNPEAATLRCLKHRHGEPRDIALRFGRTRQRFIAHEPIRSGTHEPDGTLELDARG